MESINGLLKYSGYNYSIMRAICEQLKINQSNNLKDSPCQRWFQAVLSHCSTITNFNPKSTNDNWINVILTSIKQYFYPENISAILTKNLSLYENPKYLQKHDCNNLMVLTIDDYIHIIPKYEELIIQRNVFFIVISMIIVFYVIGKFLVISKKIFGKFRNRVQTKVSAKLSENDVINKSMDLQKFEYTFFSNFHQQDDDQTIILTLEFLSKSFLSNILLQLIDANINPNKELLEIGKTDGKLLRLSKQKTLSKIKKYFRQNGNSKYCRLILDIIYDSDETNSIQEQIRFDKINSVGRKYPEKSLSEEIFNGSECFSASRIPLRKSKIKYRNQYRQHLNIIKNNS